MRSPRTQLALRAVASAALLVGGLVHLQLYFLGYRSFPDPNLGRSLLLNAAASAVLAVLVVVRPSRLADVAGIGLAASTLAFFAITRSSDVLFGFQETGLSPSPQAAIAIVAEVIAVVTLLTALVTRRTPDESPTNLRAIGLGFAAAALIVVGLGAVWAERYAVADVEATSAPPAPVTTVPVPVPTTTIGGPPVSGAPAPSPTAAATTTIPAPPAAGNEVRIVDFAFIESTLTVPVGATVTWINDDQFDHSVVADDPSFDSGDMGKSDRFEHTFTTAGQFSYICGIHPYMTGTIEVSG